MRELKTTRIVIIETHFFRIETNKAIQTMLIGICSSRYWQELDDYVTDIENIVDEEEDEETRRRVQNMVRTNLLQSDIYQNTPFILACYYGAPLQSIKQLLYLSEVAGGFGGEEIVLTEAETNDGASG